MKAPHRVALYYAPEDSEPLARICRDWLGDGPFGIGGISDAERLLATASPRRYGFHATLKAPFRLASDHDVEELRGTLNAFAARVPATDCPPLALRPLDGFLALVPTGPATAVNRLASEVVRHFEPFRAPMTAAEREKRLSADLSPRQQANLDRWGYPYVMEEFRFHMTLTDRLSEDQRRRFQAALAPVVAPGLVAPLRIDRIWLFVETEPGAPLEKRESWPLSGQPGRA